MSERKVDEALMDRIIAAVDEAGVSRAAVEGEWPECHKPRCQGHHGSPDVAMSYMKHQIIEAVKLELRYEATTRPDVSRTGDTPEQTAAFTLGVLLHQYRPDVTGTYAKAAQLIVDAYPGIIPALSGVVAEEPEWGRMVTTGIELNALPLGSIVRDVDGGIYVKEDRLHYRPWLDLSATAQHADEVYAEEPSTILWQATEPRATVLWVPVKQEGAETDA